MPSAKMMLKMRCHVSPVLQVTLFKPLTPPPLPLHNARQNNL